MRQRSIVIIVLVVAAIFVWLYTAFSSVLSAERDLLAKLDDLSRYYASMDAEYVQPLLTHPALSAADAQTLAGVAEDLQDLGRSKNASEQFEHLRAAQHSILGFFMTQGLSDDFTSDSRYLEWAKNASNLGTASSLLFAYNTSLSLYNARSQSPVGKVANYLHPLQHRLYLGIDGTLQAQPLVTF